MAAGAGRRAPGRRPLFPHSGEPDHLPQPGDPHPNRGRVRMNASELQQRKEIAVQLLSEGIEPTDLALEVDAAALPAEALLTADLAIPFPAGLAPVPQPLP